MAIHNVPSSEPHVLGDSSLTTFDVCIVGSGAGASAAARVLAVSGLKVLMLETGSNHFIGLDDPRPGMPIPRFNNDELKSARNFFYPDPLTRPRTFRPAGFDGPRSGVGDVNHLPQLVGGGQVHADVKAPRFAPFDFHLHTELGDVAGASFADWPIQYDELEPFYTESEELTGIQGDPSNNPFDPPRSKPYPLPPGVPMYVGEVIAAGARSLGLHPYPLPTAVLSRPYRGRPACNDCGFCGEFGCPINAKSPAGLVLLRDALLTGNVQLRFNSTVARLHSSADGRHVSAVEYLDPRGRTVTVQADQYILAASPIEDARILFLSDPDGLGNSSGMVGRNLLFHFSTIVVGIYKQRFHQFRGRSVTTGIADFRGRPNDSDHPLGGTIEISGGANPIGGMANTLPFLLLPKGLAFKQFLRDAAFTDRLAVLQMLSEDAPQVTNRVDLDPDVRDGLGLPVARITYSNHAFELSAARLYATKMLDIHRAAGAELGFSVPLTLTQQGVASQGATRHIMGTLRMGNDARTSVCNADGRFHDIDNLYAADGSLFPTSSGYNPTLTIEALATRVAGTIAEPGHPQRVLGRSRPDCDQAATGGLNC